jgi:hypothetical protein
MAVEPMMMMTMMILMSHILYRDGSVLKCYAKLPPERLCTE